CFPSLAMTVNIFVQLLIRKISHVSGYLYYYFMNIFGFVFPATITSVLAGFCSALAFLITGVCIMISGKYSNPQLS
ncbi:hypothetical protein QHH03_12195, partial [Aphanizomenon sp. 202]|nr:hypothetical protein [Aphanizomenon sp. 202]